MKIVRDYIESTRTGFIVILILAGILSASIATAAMFAFQPRPAEAYFSDPCTDADINQIVRGITGETPIGYACYYSTYDRNLKATDSYVTKANKITPFFYACGNSTASKFLAQAIVERSGIKPVAASPSGHCNQALYEAHIRKINTGGIDNGTIDWTKFRSGSYPKQNVSDAVQITLGKCGITNISMAIMEVTGQLPKNGNDLESPGYLGSKYFSGNGQCENTLYYHGGASYGGYDSVKTAVRARAMSTRQCGDSLITTAYQRMTGWNPLPASTSPDEFDECSIYTYNGGQWSSFDELKNYVYHSWRCQNAWVGQAYAKDYGRKARGHGNAGECSWYLYGDYSAGSFNTSPDPHTFQTVRNRVSALQTANSRAGWSFSSSGSFATGPNGQSVTDDMIRIQSANGVIANGAGNVIANGAGNVIASGAGNVIATGAGNVIGYGGGNVIASGAGNVIATGGGNIRSAYN